MSVHKRPNGTWFVRFRENGKFKSITTSCGDIGRKEAQALDLEIKAKKKRGDPLSYQITPSTLYLGHLGQSYIDDAKARGVDKKTLDSLARVLNKFLLPHLGNKPAEELTHDDIVGTVSRALADKSQSTRNRYLGYLRAMFRYAVRHELVKNNPLRHWKKTKETPRQSLLTVADLKRIKAHAPPHLAWALEVEWNTGLRPGETELFALKFEHFDFEEKVVRVYARKTKSWRVIPFSDEFLARVIAKRAESRSGYVIEYKGKPVRRLQRSFKTACEKAGIPYNVTFYDLRHLYATSLLNKGADLAAVSSLLGHSSTKMTADIYYHVMGGAKKEAVTLLPGL